MAHDKTAADPARRLAILMKDPEPIPKPPPELTEEEKRQAVDAYLASKEGKAAIAQKVSELAGRKTQERTRGDRWQEQREAEQRRVWELGSSRRNRPNQSIDFEDSNPSSAIDGYLGDL